MTSTSDWPQETVVREVRPAPDRYRNALGKYKIDRSAACASCGRCVEVCTYGVHVKPAGYAFTLRPQDHLCIGPECAETPESCVAQCPQHALTQRRNASAECMGDPRWSSDLILANWHQAATGHKAPAHLESRQGASGGGFDSMRFKFEVPGLEEPAAPQRRTARSTPGWI
jgi:ferredoxin